ncbi:MAG: 4Fe-4S binding protein [Desulfurococcaceae archaeon]
MGKSPSLLVLKKSNPKFTVIVIADRCKECGLCISICPMKVLVKSGIINKLGYRPPEPLYIDKCIGCRLCEYNCPDFAIFIERTR